MMRWTTQIWSEYFSATWLTTAVSKVRHRNWSYIEIQLIIRWKGRWDTWKKSFWFWCAFSAEAGFPVISDEWNVKGKCGSRIITIVLQHKNNWIDVYCRQPVSRVIYDSDKTKGVWFTNECGPGVFSYSTTNNKFVYRKNEQYLKLNYR